MLFKWKPEYSVKVKEIDEQHKKIFELINELDAAIKDKTYPEKLIKIIDRLVDYSVYHFDTEEKYFDKFEYKYSDEHKVEHELFKKKLAVIKKVNENKLTTSFDLIDFLEDWIINHVTDSDQKYVECFQKNSLK